MQECVNTLYEYGLNNDKLVLIYEERKHAKISIKIPTGLTERITIDNIIMQGTVFRSLICTAVMDKLAKLFYNDKNLLYKYNNLVKVPILGIVDDVLSVAKCPSSAVASNATVNMIM